MSSRFVNATSILLAMTATMVSLPLATAESICTLSESESCAVENLKPSDDDGSVLIYPGGNTRCAFDDYQDTVTTFSTNSTYFFQAFPNSDLDKSKLMILFQGGGDVHIGNRITEDFESEYEELLGNSQCLGLNYSMHMNGYNNTMAVLDWALQNYPDVDNLVVAGESAGSLAAQMHSAHIAKMWDVDIRGARFSVLSDSYVGVQPEDKPGSGSLSYYGACGNDFDWSDDVAAACAAGTASTTEMVEALLEAEPEGNWLFINSKGDLTQRYFYAVVEDGIEGYPYTDLISEEDFYSNMTAILNAYKTIQV
ncbi:hypothetical protein JM18_009356 [Phytophthora kernoviae]|uniref:Alpha/beta hydrolase fold-3 domain-containing protein n=1 Tax=Phytophthora kernoviae TaxID=325452 RepID=A0A8T0LMX9_9STRA|nr:hypothetical protein JM18_009356 [Phytophthora kernoviae]KAG2512920.1 hypothetical protein JM16_008020 [Phytophthora kernoviae]